MRSCVLLSVYKNDQLKFVQEALESLYEQSLKADILIKIDGDIDSRLEAFLQQAYADRKIVYLSKREENKGLAVSLNELIEEALDRGYEYFFRMDADDVCNKERFKKQIAFMEENRHIDVCGTFIEEFGEEIEYHKIVKYPLYHEEMFRFFGKRVPLAHVSACFRKRFFQKAGLYPVSSPTNEDTLLWMKGFAEGCQFANIPEALVRVRVDRAFFGRRGGLRKAWRDLQDRILVINALRYNKRYYFYAFALFFVNMAPSKLKQFLYKRLR